MGRRPPPAVALHFFRRRHDAIGDHGEIGVGIVQTEDEASGAHPTQG
jgi:hypothetical protein